MFQQLQNFGLDVDIRQRALMFIRQECLLCGFHHFQKGLLGVDYVERGLRILVNPLVVAMRVERAISVSHTRTTGGYGTYGAHATRTNGITALQLTARPFHTGSGNATRPGASTLTQRDDPGSAPKAMTERWSAYWGNALTGMCRWV